LKYDASHKKTLGKFGSLLGDMAMCPSTDMEMQSIEVDIIAWVQGAPEAPAVPVSQQLVACGQYRA